MHDFLQLRPFSMDEIQMARKKKNEKKIVREFLNAEIVRTCFNSFALVFKEEKKERKKKDKLYSRAGLIVVLLKLRRRLTYQFQCYS